jgi:large subunit ribosomal protein L28
LQWKRVWWAEGNRWVRLRLSTKAIKTLEKRGIGAMAKEAGINLNQY